MVGRGLKPRLRRQQDGRWRCPVCRAVTVHPTDPDATARDLEVVFVEGAESTLRRQQEAMNEWLAKPRVVSLGRTRSKAPSSPVSERNLRSAIGGIALSGKSRGT